MNPEEIKLDAQSVIAIQREKLDAMQWQLTLLEARARQFEKQFNDLLDQVRSEKNQAA